MVASERRTAASGPGPAGIAVDLRGVSRVFEGGVVAVESIDLQVEPGQFLALLGPSGCGKSTLLRLVAGLDRPTSGAVAREPSPPTTAEHAPIAYVFQDAHLLPWRDLLHNVALPLELRGVGRARRLEAASSAIQRVGLGDAAGRYPAQLSGGMRMRASLARALVTSPDLLLLDEPFAALDEITRHDLDDELHRLWRERGMTVVFVTHSLVEAAFLAQRAVVLSRRPGRIVLDHVLALPAERTAALRTDPAFAGEMRLLHQALERGGGPVP
ncbi:MAG TPA: ABC transporter ATP-binding protein [Thermoanaerobaculia bacterium]|nr:ABC transporter ATP-binding protein [Thermoanaerobaculia bacterium]